MTRDGKGLWGAKLPVKDGWTRVATPSSRSGTTEEVDRALDVMGLKLPITPEDLKRRYRELAVQWHPDRNAGKADAEAKMKDINAAAETLSGIDAQTLPNYTGARFARVLDRSEFEAAGMKFTVTMQMQVSEKYASDWIYAASFAAKSDGVYLAGYSGRVVLVNDKGVGVRVYDIGAVPRQIVDAGTFLYILTDTRLYVLRDDALYALVDMFDGGDLIVAQNGFGLLGRKRFRWFKPDGVYSGCVVAKDPIRRVYCTDKHMIVETRLSRAMIEGAPEWWQ